MIYDPRLPPALRRAFDLVDQLLADQPDIEPGTPEGDELEALLQAIVKHEEKQ